MPSRIYDLTIQLEYLKSLLTNKKENSKAFVEMQRKIRKKEKKIVNIRKDFGHKVSKYILQNYDQIFVEDISSKKLSEDNFISRINKQIFNGAFGSMKFNLKYKAEIAGIMEIIKLVKSIIRNILLKSVQTQSAIMIMLIFKRKNYQIEFINVLAVD